MITSKPFSLISASIESKISGRVRFPSRYCFLAYTIAQADLKRYQGNLLQISSNSESEQKPFDVKYNQETERLTSPRIKTAWILTGNERLTDKLAGIVIL